MNNVFSEFTKLFRDIIYRDVAYIGGGVTVLLAFYYTTFGALPQVITTPYLLYFVFVSYILGYTIMEVFSFIGIVTTGYKRPGRILSFIMRRFEGGQGWSNMPDRKNISIEKLYLCLYETSVEKRAVITRVIDLKQICVTTGSNFLVSAMIFLIRGIIPGVSHPPQNVLLGIALLLVGLTLCVRGNGHAVQQMIYMLELGKEKGIRIPKANKRIEPKILD